MYFSRCTLLAVVFAALVGCGSVGDTPTAVTPPASTDSIKAALNDVVQTGQLGSGGMTLEQEIENLRASDAAKADALKSDYEQLKGMTDPARAKAKAQEMLGKL
jgi:hypothetical protein